MQIQIKRCAQTFRGEEPGRGLNLKTAPPLKSNLEILTAQNEIDCV